MFCYVTVVLLLLQISNPPLLQLPSTVQREFRRAARSLQ
uniref:Uncharacterized protein n=1 Tax=Arundo donax TaxID=35708 RepID=A0A0A9EMW0_ARUDO